VGYLLFPADHFYASDRGATSPVFSFLNFRGANPYMNPDFIRSAVRELYSRLAVFYLMFFMIINQFKFLSDIQSYQFQFPLVGSANLPINNIVPVCLSMMKNKNVWSARNSGGISIAVMPTTTAVAAAASVPVSFTFIKAL